MEAKSSSNSSSQTFGLLGNTVGAPSNGLGLSFLDSLQTQKLPLPPPPPFLEILPSQVSSSVKYNVESVNLDGLTLLKGRVSTEEVFSLSNSDLVPGKYEGGLKLWEGSLDLVKTLCTEVLDSKLSLKGKQVLELGCGHGLPGIFSCLKGASVVHFQDFNAEVLQCLTIPNVNSNIHNKSQSFTIDENQCNLEAEIRYFSGDWSEVHNILPYACNDANQLNCPGLDQSARYDVILMAETVYSISTLPSLYNLIQKCITRPHGVVYMAAKKYYFGVGGGSRRFISMAEKDGIFSASLVAEVTDGSSNVREVWKLDLK
ncbi:protein modifying enzyme [Lithospermum erythrorhizon]|uniref:protein-histidine N-methyltransferase n=1 Tax=Lithospermum erythrorhizon TaxID=34254 RepID=A0AAV3RLT2_LITER